MTSIKLLGSKFFKDLEDEVKASIGVSLVQNKKVVSARTIRSVRADTTFSNEGTATISGYGGEGMPYIILGKPANTKMPLIYKGVEVGKSGRPKKVFELPKSLQDWKAIKNYRGSDFVLARAIAKNPRKGVDIAEKAMRYLRKKSGPKTLKRFKNLFTSEIVKNFKDE